MPDCLCGHGANDHESGGSCQRALCGCGSYRPDTREKLPGTLGPQVDGRSRRWEQKDAPS